MKLIQALRARSGDPLNFQEWTEYFNFNGLRNPLFGPTTTLGQKQEEPASTFEGYVQSVYKANGIVFACELARLMLFSEARFQFRRRVLGRPGELFGTDALAPLETPWPNGTTGDLLTRMIQDADLGGNFYGALRKKRGKPIRLPRLRPDWVTIILGSDSEPDSDIGFGDVDAEVLGYIYKPGGPNSGKSAQNFLAHEVVHFAPVPDPLAAFRGMSWLTPVIREVMGDQAASTHKLKFFEQGATPNMVVSFDASVQRDDFEKWMKLYEQNYGGATNAYKTMYLGAGAKAEAVGADMRNVDFKKVQGAGETRIAAAAGVPPIIAGFSEGLESATYSNYGQARRRFADGTMRPLWRQAAGSLATVIDVPRGAELWYDDRDIPFLQEDRKDEAEIQQKQAQTLKTLVEAGFTPDSAKAAVDADDMGRLEHSGLVSVQLQPPGAVPPGGPSSGE
ncbi:MAG TPA: phage portal protein [Solirubrobacterales bacterium]|nr:phage portal protein [Solirubrobacterales bacterium]